MKNLSRTTARRSGKKPGKDVDEYMKEQLEDRGTEFQAAILSVMNNAPNGLLATDVVDRTIGALLDFADCDMVASRILKNESLTTDLHERMTRDI